MRRILLSLLSALLLSGVARAQIPVTDAANITQSIVNSVTELVQTSTTAENMIGNFKETMKIYRQGKEYYDKLQSVHNLIKDARKVKETVELVSEISQIYSTNFNRMLTDKNFSPAELAAISSGYSKLLKESGNLLADIKNIVSASNGLSMTDAERMRVIDEIHSKMVEHRNLTRYFSKKSISVSFIRSQQSGDMARVRTLYGDPSDRYW